MENVILEVIDLNIEFHDHIIPETVVYDFDLTLREGEIVGLVGESGSGKSMSALAIAGLLSRKDMKKRGRILYRGTDLLTCPRRDLRAIQGNDISMIFQEPLTSLNPVKRIYDQVEEPLRIHTDLNKNERYEKVLNILKEVELRDPELVMRQYPHELSGGMRQRVMIASAMIMEPKILIADEPTTALDVTIQAQILDLLRQLKSRINSSIMFITHDLGVIAEMADYVVVMYAGRIVEKGTADDIFHHPAHPYTIGLMASKPVVGKKIDKLYSIPGKVPNPINMPNYCYFKDRCEMCLARCDHDYPQEVSLSPTHKVSCYRYYDQEGNHEQD